MSPFQIEILLHYYSSGTDHSVVIKPPPIWHDTRMWFLNEGFLRRIDDNKTNKCYEITDRGRCYIEGLLAMPLPVWAMPVARERSNARSKFCCDYCTLGGCTICRYLVNKP